MTPLVRRWDELRLALMFLTRLPVGTLREPIPSLADARWAYPLVGLAVGAVGWAAQHGALWLGLGPLPSAVLALGAMTLLTGGLHHDGLADFADGIGGGRDRVHCLEIMRDSRIGSYGALALIFAIALSAGALTSFERGAPLALFLLLGVASRLAMLMVLDLLRPAREVGLGHTASARSPRAWITGISVVLLIELVAGTIAWLPLVGVALASASIAALAYRRIGGQTGDVVGAAQLSSETLGWLVAAAVLAA